MGMLNITQTHLLWVPDVCTLQLFHVFKDPHNITHHVKWDVVQGDPFKTCRHQIACRETSQ